MLFPSIHPSCAFYLRKNARTATTPMNAAIVILMGDERGEVNMVASSGLLLRTRRSFSGCTGR